MTPSEDKLFRAVVCLLELALKQLPPGTKVRILESEIRTLTTRDKPNGAVRVRRTNPMDTPFDELYEASLIDDPRQQTLKRKFDLDA